MAQPAPSAGSRPSTVKLPAVRGPESKKKGGTQASWRSTV